MLDGRPLIDTHVHAARQPTLKPAWRQWARDFGDPTALDRVYDADGTVDSARFDAYRVKLVANINPHLHHPVDDELRRQIDLGAVAGKVHPVHAGVAADSRWLYPAYEVCQSSGIPLVVHCGTSSFPGSSNRFVNPVLLDDVLHDFRGLTIVLAHGGRGWWCDAAAFLALSKRTGLDRTVRPAPGPGARVLLPPQLGPAGPPNDLRHRLAGRTRHRAQRAGRRRALPDEAAAGLVLAGNAARVYNLKPAA